ncbi:hypothetical protein RJD38_03215 [Vibrio scophthalmi]|uniref:Uncharacterized protein n=2 Tax=Vibrio scophthalmi TaxID=45658 RepID=A0A1B1NR52_9VIBR|nr:MULTISPECIES: hypothetical protein [Vibrio]ANS86239.1 hypothetical protein VSVS12_02483 [Vibrio scophthalmi]ANU35591.1 hypothetical protein VSVS05_00454 [Vibrio scophthalmi]EGU29869.1 hypothetical protein VIBRN418_19784 [Vibrio sp. N418]EGU38991.1 hypothetical protein VIS19158_05463 [Vibrio scophthalmi LMG 19158]MCY9803970.1 hypothetical protein [Vibrio scophthalmi]
MTMVCAKDFAEWLKLRFGSATDSVTISREEVNHLTGRQRLDPNFVHDVHYELMPHGLAFVTDTLRETFFLIPIGKSVNWRDQLEFNYEKELYCNIFPIIKSG